MFVAELAGAGIAFGLAQAVHCAGMCGVFALRAAGGGSPGLRIPLYLAGKGFTYLFIGALAGWLGSRLEATREMQAILGVGAAGVVIATGATALIRPRSMSALAAAMGRTIAPFVPRVTGLGPFALGAATGFLPCGVVWLAALQGAATGHVRGGLAFMAGFALGTGPILAIVGLAGRNVLERLGPRRLRVAGAALVIVTGLIMAWRSAAPLVATPGTTPCCH